MLLPPTVESPDTHMLTTTWALGTRTQIPGLYSNYFTHWPSLLPRRQQYLFVCLFVYYNICVCCVYMHAYMYESTCICKCLWTYVCLFIEAQSWCQESALIVLHFTHWGRVFQRKTHSWLVSSLLESVISLFLVLESRMGHHSYLWVLRLRSLTWTASSLPTQSRVALRRKIVLVQDQSHLLF